MHSLAPEIRTLRASDEVDDSASTLPLALEERRLFSVRRELLLVLYGGVLTLVAGVGLAVRNNLDRIGPVALLTAILILVAGCYGFALRRGPHGPRALSGDYLLLLGALLLSAALGYAETQFHLLGEQWSRHLLLLAVVHAVSAYAFDSRLVLAVALTSLAGWLGVETRLGDLWEPRHAVLGAGWRSLALALSYLLARQLHRVLRSQRDFLAVYEQFAITFAFWGALALGFDAATRWFGALLLLALAAGVGRLGLRWRRESFVLYAIGYATVGLVGLEAQVLREPLLVSNIGLATIVAAVVLLFRLRGRLKESQP